MDKKLQLELAYGEETVSTIIDTKNILAEVSPKVAQGVENPLAAIEQALANPTGSKPVAELVKEKNPNTIVIVVNDVTRPTPYKYMLPPLIKQLEQAGVKDEQITFVVATGIHRGNTDQENRDTLTPEIVERFRVINHDCDKDLVSLGNMKDGTELIINKEVALADMVISTGLIGLHYFAGYSGGRKSILPGVASRDLITNNHAKMTDPKATTGNYKDNPVHWIMLEAARMAGVDFILNVVTNTKKEIVAVAAGEVEDAWLAGVKACEKMSVVKIAQTADVVIACAGGHPKDINIYQAQKALENAAQAVKAGGTILLVARCSEGYGEDTFADWVREASKLQDIFDRFDKEFVLGGHKAFAIAQVVREKDVIMVSDMSKEDTEKLYFRYAQDLDQALAMVKEKHGDSFTTYLMPQAGLVLPQVE